MSRRKKAKLSILNILRDGKTAVLAVTVFIVAFVVFFGFRHFNSEAAVQNKVTRGVVNSLSDIEKKKDIVDSAVDDGNAYDRDDVGHTKDNPFLILEIVPWLGYSEFGYMVEGCEPVDYATQAYYGTAAQGFDTIYTGTAVGAICTDEYKREFGEEFDNDIQYESDGKTVKKCTCQGCWDNVLTKVDTKDKKYEKKYQQFRGVHRWKKQSYNMTFYGYYEKVGKNKGYFKLDGETGETGGILSSGTVYRPTFKNVGEGNGDFIWVTLGRYSASGSWTTHAKRENKYNKSAEKDFSFADGDREYCFRTVQEFYEMPNIGAARMNQSLFMYYNDFMRTSLDVRTRQEIEDFSVVIKVIEPTELNENPEWIKYADFIYCHRRQSYGDVVNLWNNSEGKDTRIVTTSSASYENAGFGKLNNGKQNDISWQVAMQMFLKVNGLGQYTEDTYAAGVFDVNLYTTKSDYESKSGLSYTLLDYETMQPATRVMSDVGYNNNMYKFCIMNFLMKQENFYEFFLTGDDPVVNMTGDVGINNRQQGDSQTYWSHFGFLPDNSYYGYTNGDWSWKEFKDKYGLSVDASGTSFMNFVGNQVTMGASATYNGNQFMTQFVGTTTVTPTNSETGDAFDWFDKDMEDPRDSLSTADVIYYLLHYKKNGGQTEGGRKRLELNVLDIEPSNSFTTLTMERLKALFPAAKYKVLPENIHVDRMTTAEFNSRKLNIEGDYDLVYIGTDVEKFNTEKESGFSAGEGNTVTLENDTRYNDMSSGSNIGIKGKVYLHVGDAVTGGDGKKYRTSGNDISALKYTDLVNYVKAGKYLMFADELYDYKTAKNRYLSRRILDRGSNVFKLVEKFAGEKKNVIRLSAQLMSSVVTDLVSYPKVTIDKTPAKYNGNSADDTTLNGNKLTFKFTLSDLEDDESYGLRLYVDLNGDGVFSDDSESSEMVNSWCTEKKNYSKDGTYTVTYEIPKDRGNGAIAWKFVIYRVGDGDDCKIVTGVSRYASNSDQEKAKEVRVLQVVDKPNGNANLNYALSSKTGLFYKYVKDLKDYTITVKTVSLSEYLENFVSAEALHSAENAFSFDGSTYYYPSEYCDYNVYLISCGKEFGKADNSKGAVSFISFMERRGNSVIFTNDSIASDSEWLVSAKQLKDSAGVSRFTSASSSNKQYNDTPDYAVGTQAADVKTYDTGDYESLEYTYMAAMYAGDNSKNSYPAFNSKIWTQVNGSDKMKYSSGRQEAKKLTRTNTGAVTSYPYKIDEAIGIAGTSAQTFQLNMDNPMSTVWYSLGGKDDTAYGISPNDGTNNYYLYNVENVFYDGIDLTDDIGDDEMKLFINTLIGAYEAAYKDPSVIVDKAVALKKGDVNPSITLESYNVADAIRVYNMEVTSDSNEVVKDIKYKEYLKDAKELTSSQATVKVSPTPAPAEPDAGETNQPEETKKPAVSEKPKETEKPSETEASDSYVLYEPVVPTEEGVQLGKKSGWMKKLGNDVVMEINYVINAYRSPGTVLYFRGGLDNDDAWGNIGYQIDSVVDGKNISYSEQPVVASRKVTILELKQSLGIASDKDLEYLFLSVKDQKAKISSVKLLDVSIDPDDDGDVKLNETDVTNQNYIAKTDTHKIYFTPYDGYLIGGKIVEFTARFTADMSGESTTMPITEIYREYVGKDGEKHVKKLTSESGIYSEGTDHYLKDSVQYFILYNESYVNVWEYVRFGITNKKRAATTYLHINNNKIQQTSEDEVYIFDID